MAQDTCVIETQFVRLSILSPKSDLVSHAHRHAHVVLPLDTGSHDQIYVDGRWQELDSSSIHLVNPLEVHGFHRTSLGEQSSYLLLYLQPEWLAREHGLSLAKPFAKRRVMLTDETRRQARAFAEAMLCGYELDDLIDLEIKHFVDLTIRRTFDEGDDNYQRMHGQLGNADWRIKKAMRYMEQHLDARCSLSEVARDAGLSRPHFFNLFAKQIGMTPRLYFNLLRIEKALIEMRDPMMRMSELADELGFSSQGNFSRFFREHVGVSPLGYRQAHH